jgi:hypothetical protein
MQGVAPSGSQYWQQLAVSESETVKRLRCDSIVIFHDIAPGGVHREAPRSKEPSINCSQLQAGEHDKFAAHLYRSRREYRSDCDHAGKLGKPIELRVIATFRTAESLGFRGDFRQWEDLLRVGE